MKSHKAWHDRGYLPHFDLGATLQLVTFRLADSIPRARIESMTSAGELDRRVQIEAMIDEGRGSCLLGNPVHATIVKNAPGHFDGARYKLMAWVIMPNHVHALIEQMEGHPLGDVVHSWKSFSANTINRQRGAQGTVWAPDYFDRYIRNEEHYLNAIHYIENNPVKAGLTESPDKWPFSSLTSGKLPEHPGRES